MGGVGKAPSAEPFATSRKAAERLGHERVSEIQRARILVAMAEVACERGAGDVSVGHVVERAGVSRRTFYELFDGREDCFLAAFDEAVVRACGYVSGGYDREVDWAANARSGLEALLAFLEQEPVLARLAIVESSAGGARALERRRHVIDRIVTVVDAGREGMNGRSLTTAFTAEGVVGGVVSVIHGRLVSGDNRRLVDLINPLMSMIVLPYLGPDAARKQLEQPVASARAPIPLANGNPLKHLDMRLTYRTVRALSAVAANPGSSNRVIGDVSGIDDQGQVSKLLARLERLGLVENTRGDRAKGATNAWGLTERGKEVADVVTTSAAVS
jgi:AcrR family transcriptional regulator/DNA-binding MarR family transcriptional regulator